MKRIEFIAPVESMRGNLSGNQDLQYAPDNGKAWDATGEKASANNYAPRFVGAKRRDGLKYFSVRTKSTTIMSEVMREQMASLSIANTIQFSALHNLAIQTQVLEWFEKTAPAGVSLRQYVMQRIMNALKMKDILFRFNNTGDPATSICNPFAIRVTDGAQSVYAGLSVDRCAKLNTLIYKFWTQLGLGTPIRFEVHYGEQVFYALGSTETQFNDTYLDVAPQIGFIPAVNALYGSNGLWSGEVTWDTAGENLRVLGLDNLNYKTLYGRPKDSYPDDDVVVKVTDKPRADYIYTLK